MPLSNRAPAAPIGKLKGGAGRSAPKRRAATSTRSKVKASGKRKMSAKQRKYFGGGKRKKSRGSR
jgi:hypothetical protein